jgi:hypothetical protein
MLARTGSLPLLPEAAGPVFSQPGVTDELRVSRQFRAVLKPDTRVATSTHLV